MILRACTSGSLLSSSSSLLLLLLPEPPDEVPDIVNATRTRPTISTSAATVFNRLVRPHQDSRPPPRSTNSLRSSSGSLSGSSDAAPSTTGSALRQSDSGSGVESSSVGVLAQARGRGRALWAPPLLCVVRPRRVARQAGLCGACRLFGAAARGAASTGDAASCIFGGERRQR